MTLESIFDLMESNTPNGALTIKTILVCAIFSLIYGVIIALSHKYTSKYTKNFLITITILPILVMSVMMMVNGNLGTSIAILGAFSLVRFRSIAGNSKEILSIFFSMTIGLACGMGQIVFAGIITLLVVLVEILLTKVTIFDANKNERVLKINVPENMDYNDMFDEIFNNYLKSYELINVKTTNMGTLFETTYKVVFKNSKEDKKFIDDIRIKNCNLKVQISQKIDESEF